MANYENQNSANIIVQNRLTGQLEEEKMQVYIRLGIRLLYKVALPWNPYVSFTDELNRVLEGGWKVQGVSPQERLSNRFLDF